MKGYIYNLKEKGDIFYIGATTHPESRLYTHNNRFKYAEFHGGLCCLKKNFKSVEMEIIEEVDFDNYTQLFAIENYWIHQFIAWGFELINKSYAGAKLK